MFGQTANDETRASGPIAVLGLGHVEPFIWDIIRERSLEPLGTKADFFEHEAAVVRDVQEADADPNAHLYTRDRLVSYMYGQHFLLVACFRRVFDAGIHGGYDMARDVLFGMVYEALVDTVLSPRHPRASVMIDEVDEWCKDRGFPNFEKVDIAMTLSLEEALARHVAQLSSE